jgi:hypothetical protein
MGKNKKKFNKNKKFKNINKEESNIVSVEDYINSVRNSKKCLKAKEYLRLFDEERSQWKFNV